MVVDNLSQALAFRVVKEIVADHIDIQTVGLSSHRSPVPTISQFFLC
jgi:hypothetical protein